MGRKSPKLTNVKYTYADTPKETSPYLKEYIKTSKVGTGTTFR